MTYIILLYYSLLVKYVCKEYFVSVNGVEDEINLTYDAILDNFKKWT